MRVKFKCTLRGEHVFYVWKEADSVEAAERQIDFAHDIGLAEFAENAMKVEAEEIEDDEEGPRPTGEPQYPTPPT